jgi:hypothetical protein
MLRGLSVALFFPLFASQFFQPSLLPHSFDQLRELLEIPKMVVEDALSQDDPMRGVPYRYEDRRLNVDTRFSSQPRDRR